ncbi:putative membrane protein, required for colicin V production [Caulobacter sp. AP07]|uniref:CvpA family protein n=1 Tax=Caulobacter sp. AP07 TaxID=1144304 RepID=UPI0002721B80|nr:CvpA family protein [Caulobacter sp. AP07]EJL27169.1 putative membrane protein, required for colicin V production [Caulobacter sp. AP07]
MTPFDIIAGIILLVSGLVGFARGASRELTSALSFIAAAIIALLGLRVTGPLFRGMMDPDWAATAAAILLTFVVAFIALRLLGAALTRTLHADGALGTLDRLMGLAFGLIRGLVVLGVFNLVFNMATPPGRVPAWVSQSALYPLSTASARVLKVFAPKGTALAGKLAPAIEDAVHDGASDKPSDRKPGEPSYDQSQRRSVDDLVEKSR